MQKTYITTFILAMVLLFLPGTAVFGIVLLFLMAIPIVVFYIEYLNSCYRKVSKNSILRVFFDKGIFGEFQTVKAVEAISEKERIIVNIYLEKAKTESETTEVDVIYINSSGIFVLESKNYNGWIYGKENDKKWMQVLNKNTKNRFYNPVKQNAGHISAIEKLLGDEYKGLCRNVIVFSSSCTLKDITIVSSDILVLKRNKLRQSIKELSFPQKLSYQQIDDIADKLFTYSNADAATKKMHIETIEAKKANYSMQKIPVPKTTEQAIDLIDTKEEKSNGTVRVCPKCGAPMALRTALKGENAGKEFWGCSDFPKCRSVVNIKE